MPQVPWIYVALPFRDIKQTGAWGKYVLRVARPEGYQVIESVIELRSMYQNRQCFAYLTVYRKNFPARLAD